MLNSKQQEVVAYSGDELLVLAGAGSGKTRCVTEKIKVLLESGYDIDNIVAITFTNKAADEMVERISTFKKIKREKTLIGTFHSFCYKMIKNELKYFGLPRVRICDDNQTEYLLKEAVESLGKDLESCPNAKNKIEKLKNRLIYPGDKDMPTGWIRLVFEKYEELLNRCMLFDFNDLISKTVLMLKNNATIREKYQNLFKYIIVDEFQDVNNAQFELVKLLHKPGVNRLMVVGDDAQAIYGFRDSNPAFIIDFCNSFPRAHSIKLEQNYRSTKKILSAANIVINKNINGLQKTLWTENPEGENITVCRFDGDKGEANFIAQTVLKAKQQGKKYSDFCVLYRANSQSRIIEDAFAVAGIPSQVVQGVSFYDRMEVKDIMSYLRFLDNPHDLLSFRRCVQTPKRGIGKKAIDTIMDQCKEKGGTVLDIMANSDKGPIKDFYNMICGIREQKSDSINLIQNLVKNIEYAKHLESKAKSPNEVYDRLESIGQLQTMAKEADDLSLSSLLDFISLRTNADYTGDESTDKVRLSTVHSAKGLEFDTVFLIGMNKKTFPHEILDPEIEEARRLYYVAITRAKQKLYISHTDTSCKYGTVTFNEPSSFLFELPKEVVEKRIGGQNDFFTQRQSSKW